MRSPVRSPASKGRGRFHDRHSGTGTRGLPKKNGAGGKTVWGSEMDQNPVACLDKKDPNYNSDEEQPPQLELTPATLPPPAEPQKDASAAAPAPSAATAAPATSN